MEPSDTQTTLRRRHRSNRIAGWLLVTLVAIGCGRERVNPIDPNFIGNEALSPPTEILASGDIGMIKLQWTAVRSTDLAGYGVWRSTSATDGYLRLPGEVADSLITTSRVTFVDTTIDLSASRVYFYKINTIDTFSRSSQLSVFVSAEALEDARPPGIPGDLSAVSDVETGFINLTWSAPLVDAGNTELTGLDLYSVFRSKDTQNAFVKIATVSSRQTTFVDSSSLELDVQYYYRVSAADGEGNESSRSSAAVITTAGTGIAAPAGLRTTSKIGEIEVSWNPVSEPSLLGYLVTRSASTQQVFVPVTSDTLFTTAQTSYIDTDVSAGDIFFYRVQAVVDDPERGLVRSDLSAFVDGEALDDNNPPAAPGDVIVSLDDDNLKLVSLSWTAPSLDSDGGDLTTLAGYKVFRSRQTASSYALLTELPGAVTSYSDTTVDALTVYFYAVSAVDSTDNVGPRSSGISVTTRGLLAPSGLSATPGSQLIELSWSSNTEPELTGYQVLRFASAEDEDPVATFTTVQTTFVDSPLTTGQTYVYRVRALGTGGSLSALSTFVSAEPEGSLTAPRNVSALGGITQVTVSWTANSEPELTGYQVLRYDDPSESVPNATFNTVQTSLVDSPLIAGTTFVYRVRALGLGGIQSDLSLFASAEVPPDTRAPATPTIFSAELTGSTAIQLSWQAPTLDTGGFPLTGLSEYRIFRSTGGGFEQIATVATPTLTFTNTGLDAATTYTYRISAADLSRNESSQSASVSVATSSSGAVDAPSNVVATAEASPVLLVRITWTHPAEFTDFLIQRKVAPVGSSSGGSFVTIATGLTSSPYEDTDVVSGTTYIYRVQTRIDTDFSVQSNEAILSVP